VSSALRLISSGHLSIIPIAVASGFVASNAPVSLYISFSFNFIRSNGHFLGEPCAFNIDIMCKHDVMNIQHAHCGLVGPDHDA